MTEGAKLADTRQCVYCASAETICCGPWDDGLGNGGVEWYCNGCDKAWSEPRDEDRIVFLRFRSPAAPDGSARSVVYGPFSWAVFKPGRIRASKRRGLGPLDIVTVATAADSEWLLGDAIPGAVRRFVECVTGHAPPIGASFEEYHDMDGVRRSEA